MRLDFDYEEYSVRVSCQYDNREDGRYLGYIDFEVYNELGEDVTQDIPNTTTLAIHQLVVEKAQQEYDMDRRSV